MKKVLLATSFLVATAGFAAAEVKLSGDGRMGVVYNGDDWNFSSRARVKFNLSGESDNGLSFGAGFRADHQGRSATGSTTGANQGSAGSIWVSGAFGKIEMGDTVGAAEAVLFDMPEIGFTDLKANGAFGEDNDISFLTGDSEDGITADGNPSLLYTYTFDAFTVAASFTDGHVGQSSVDDNQAYALGFKYAAGDYSVALAYEKLDYVGGGDTSVFWIGGDVDLNGTKISAIFGDFSDNAIDQQYALGVTSNFNGVGIGGFVKQTTYTAAGVDDVTHYGLTASYDLGGGASIVGGIIDSDQNGTDPKADLGLKFKF